MPDQDDHDFLAPIRRDAAWPRAVAALHRYAGEATGQMEDGGDGSRYWVPEPTERHAEALRDLVDARLPLVQRHKAWQVDAALQGEADRAGLFPNYVPGTDCDGMTSYEPHGNPMTPARQAFAYQDAQLRYAGLDDSDLHALVESRDRRIEAEFLGDNFDTIRRLRTERDNLKSILAERQSVREARWGPAGPLSPEIQSVEPPPRGLEL